VHVIEDWSLISQERDLKYKEKEQRGRFGEMDRFGEIENISLGVYIRLVTI